MLQALALVPVPVLLLVLVVVLVLQPVPQALVSVLQVAVAPALQATCLSSICSSVCTFQVSREGGLSTASERPRVCRMLYAL